MDQLLCASLSHTDYWYEVGMLKVSAYMTTWYYLLEEYLLGKIMIRFKRNLVKNQTLLDFVQRRRKDIKKKRNKLTEIPRSIIWQDIVLHFIEKL